MRWPLDKVIITQYWGNKLILNGKDVYAQWGLKGHNGVDLKANNGTPVYAPHDGIIKERRYDSGGYGYYLKIESEKEGSVLAHLKDWAVNINKPVREGDLVGWADNSGFSTGPHVHHGYYKIPRNRNDGYLGYINQLPLMEDSMDDEAPDETDANNWRALRERSKGWQIKDILGHDTIESVDDCEKLFFAVKDIKTDSNNWRNVRKIYKQYHIESVEDLTSFVSQLELANNCEELLSKQGEKHEKIVNGLKETHQNQMALVKKQLKDRSKLTIKQHLGYIVSKLLDSVR